MLCRRTACLLFLHDTVDLFRRTSGARTVGWASSHTGASVNPSAILAPCPLLLTPTTTPLNTLWLCSIMKSLRKRNPLIIPHLEFPSCRWLHSHYSVHVFLPRRIGGNNKCNHMENVINSCTVMYTLRDGHCDRNIFVSGCTVVPLHT